MKVFLYSVSVTVLSAIGSFLIITIGQTLTSSSASVVDVAVSVLAFSLWGAAIFGPAAIFFCLLVALVAGLLRKRVWWVGALAGFIPSLATILFFNQPNSDSAYEGTADQLAIQNATMVLSSIAFVTWCSAVGAVLINLSAFSASADQLKERTLM